MIPTFEPPRLRDHAAGMYASAFLSLLAIAAGPAAAGDTATSLDASQSRSVFSETVTLSATVTGTAPSGTVQFRSGGKAIGTATLPDEPVAYTAVAPGTGHTCAIVTGGTVQCWGENAQGQLGDGTLVDRSTPGAVVGLAGPAVALASGLDHSCALLESGAVQCWGAQNHGQLGNGVHDDDTPSADPVDVINLSAPATAIASKTDFTCALIQGGTVQCWGINFNGQIGDGSTGVSETPGIVSGIGNARAIAVGRNHACAILRNGSLKCWGRNQLGQAGNGTSDNLVTPVTVAGLGGTPTSVAAGAFHTCVLLEGGAVECWGRGDFGQLGDGNGTDSAADSTSPATVTGLTGTPVALALGNDYSCALIESGSLQCWGRGNDGQLGDGSTEDRLAPVSVTDLGGTVIGADAGALHNCALIEGGTLQCWGKNGLGRLGDGTESNSSTPTDVLDPVGAILDRTASLTVDDLDAGAHTLTARYFGSPGNSASTSATLSHRVAKADTKIKQIKIRPKTPKSGKTAKATVKVQQLSPATAKPDGKMKVVLDGKKIANVSVKNGKASFKLPRLDKGKGKLKVKYNGTGNFEPSADKTKFNVKSKR